MSHDKTCKERSLEVIRGLNLVVMFTRSYRRPGYAEKVRAAIERIRELTAAYLDAVNKIDGLQAINDMLADEHHRQTRIENAALRWHAAKTPKERGECLRALKEAIISNLREGTPP